MTDSTAGSSGIDLNRVAGAEFIGTAVLIMGGPGTAILAGDAVGIFGIAVAFGLALAVMAYVIGSVSGCHINPAVTLGMWVTRKVSLRQAVYSWIGQIAGGIVGAFIIWLIVARTDAYERGNFASNGWDREGLAGGLSATIVVEIVFTALLVMVVLATTSRKFAPGFAGLVAGGTLTLIHLITIPIDNTSVNPARSLATAIFADADPNALGQVWAFIIFPLIGSLVGVGAWMIIDEEAHVNETVLATR